MLKNKVLTKAKQRRNLAGELALMLESQWGMAETSLFIPSQRLHGAKAVQARCSLTASCVSLHVLYHGQVVGVFLQMVDGILFKINQTGI